MRIVKNNNKAGKWPKRKGQALVEMALMSLVLGLLLAAAIDFGRAFYTLTVVTNMAGEGAAFAALYPDQDYNSADLTTQRCSALTPVDPKRSIQERARLVAKDRGLVIERSDQQLAVITVSTDGRGTDCSDRCVGRTMTVTVLYTLDDLFLPSFLGMRNIPITRSASQILTRSVDRYPSCSGGN